MNTAIEVKNISRSFRSVKKSAGFKGTIELLLNPKYETKEALKNINLEIKMGSFIGLVGANGAGKTTLLKILSGLIPPSTGNATVLGFNPFDKNLEFRKSISLVMGQKAQLWWDLPALDAFDLLRVIYDIPSDTYKKRVDELTELLDVKNLLHTQIRRLSLGERMKMEVIGALLHFPKILFLDEPTIGLDVLAAHKLRDFLKAHNEAEKTTIILTSHSMDDIEKLCSRVLLIKNGSLIFDGDPKKLVEQNECQIRVRILEEVSANEICTMLELNSDKVQKPQEGLDGTYKILTSKNQAPSLIQKLLQKYTLVELGIEEPSLELVIKRIYENQLDLSGS